MRTAVFIGIALSVAACSRDAPAVKISLDEKKILASIESPKLFPQGFSFSPRGVPLSKRQLLDLNSFLLQAAGVGSAQKEEVRLPKDSQLFQAIDVSMARFDEWARTKEEFSTSSSIPASRVAAVVERFAR